MPKKKDHSELYAFLEAKGVLDTGNDAAIKKAKAEYWKQYKRSWIKQKRQATHTFTISYSDKEMRVIDKGTREHNLSRTQMIKQSSLAYLKQGYVVPDKEMVGNIRSLLALNYNAIQDLQEADKLSNNAAITLLKRIEKLEQTLLHFLQSPHQ